MLTDSTPQDDSISPGSPLSSYKHHNSSSNTFRKPLFHHRTWVRGRDPDPGEPSQNASEGALSLLQRMREPLLNRLSSPDTAQVTPSADKFTEASREGYQKAPMDEGEAAHTVDEKMRESPQPAIEVASGGVRIKSEETLPIIPLPTRTERPVGRKRGSRSTIDVFGEPTVPPQMRQHSGSFSTKTEDRTDTPTNDTTVDIILSEVFPSDPPGKEKPAVMSSPPPFSPSDSTGYSNTAAVTKDIPANMQTSSKPATLGAAPSSSSQTLPRAVLDQCRGILIPLVGRNAKLRRPDVDPEAVKRRASLLLSDKMCADFLELARKVRDQMKGKERDALKTSPRSPPRESAGFKRARTDLQSPSQCEPPAKVPRAGSPMDVVHASGDVGTFITTNHTPTASEMDVEGLLAQDNERQTSAPPSSPGDTTEHALRPHSDSLPKPRVPPPTSFSITPDSQQDSMVIEVETQPALISPIVEETPARSRDIPEQAAENTPFTPSEPEARSACRSPSPRLPFAVAENEAAASGTVTPTPQASSDKSHHEAITSPPILNTTLGDERIARSPTEGDMRGKQEPEAQSDEDILPCSVPGVWSAVMGCTSPDIEEIQFLVDDVTANAVQCWAEKQSSFYSLNDRHVAVHILCLPRGPVDDVLDNPTATPTEIAAGLWDIKSEWPSEGDLVVEVNTTPEVILEGPPSYRWFPSNKNTTHHLEITSAIRRGRNTIRLIQLAGMSDRLFVVHASEPLEEERAAVYANNATWDMISKMVPQSPRG